MNAQDWINPANWANRRKYLWAVTAFTMTAIVAALFGPVNVTVADAVVGWGFAALVMFTSTYVFGATWDHANVRSMITKKDDVAVARAEATTAQAEATVAVAQVTGGTQNEIAK